MAWFKENCGSAVLLIVYLLIAPAAVEMRRRANLL